MAELGHSIYESMIDDLSIDRFIGSSRYRISHRFNDHIDRLNVHIDELTGHIDGFNRHIEGPLIRE